MWRIQAANYHFATRNSEFQGSLATGFKTKTADAAPAMWSNNETNSCEATIFFSRQYNQKSTICDVLSCAFPVRKAPQYDCETYDFEVLPWYQ